MAPNRPRPADLPRPARRGFSTADQRRLYENWFKRGRCAWCKEVIPTDHRGVRSIAVPWDDGRILQPGRRVMSIDLEGRLVFGYVIAPVMKMYQQLHDAGADVVFLVCSAQCEDDLGESLDRASSDRAPN
jgi:hypothetical protein